MCMIQKKLREVKVWELFEFMYVLVINIIGILS